MHAKQLRNRHQALAKPQNKTARKLHTANPALLITLIALISLASVAIPLPGDLARAANLPGDQLNGTESGSHTSSLPLTFPPTPVSWRSSLAWAFLPRFSPDAPYGAARKNHPMLFCQLFREVAVDVIPVLPF